MEEKIENVRYYYESEEGIQYIKYRNIWGSFDGSFDGLIWNYKGKEIKLELDKYVNDIHIYTYIKRVFIRYPEIGRTSHPIPYNLVVYTPKGEIETILSPPILPTGKKGAGFALVHGFSDPDEDAMSDKYLDVWVWEHEGSYWFYFCKLNTETLEFTVGDRSRY